MRRTRKFVWALVFTTLLMLSAGAYAQPPVRGTVVLQDAAAMGNGSVFVAGIGTVAPSLWVEWSAGTSAGTVTIEEAAVSDYAGTWASIIDVDWVAASATDAVHLPAANYAVLRARISSNIVGGTVTVRILYGR
jgi:hypothetical protein